MEWRKIRRNSDGFVNEHTLDYMYVQLPLIVMDKHDNEVILVNKENWLDMRGEIDRHYTYSHYLPIPELKEIAL